MCCTIMSSGPYAGIARLSATESKTGWEVLSGFFTGVMTKMTTAMTRMIRSHSTGCRLSDFLTAFFASLFTFGGIFGDVFATEFFLDVMFAQVIPAGLADHGPVFPAMVQMSFFCSISKGKRFGKHRHDTVVNVAVHCTVDKLFVKADHIRFREHGLPL